MFEGGASVTRAKAKGNFAEDLPEDAISLALDIEIFQRNGSVFFSIVLGECPWCSQA
jgi:hypothetical protein